MSRIEQSPLGRMDVAEISDYIARDNPTAAYRLVDRIHEKFEMLARQPLMGEPREDLAPDLRQFTLGNYVIYYTPLDDGIRVRACR